MLYNITMIELTNYSEIITAVSLSNKKVDVLYELTVAAHFCDLFAGIREYLKDMLY